MFAAKRREGPKTYLGQEHQLYYYYNNFTAHSEKESKPTLSEMLNAAGVATAFMSKLYCTKAFIVA